MIYDFEYYVSKGVVRKTNANPALARSLVFKSEIRLKRVLREQITEAESSIIFEDIYEIMREAAQALMQVKGYKPYSHEALIAFLKKEKLMSNSKINRFNKYRILRNKSVYEAKKVSVDTSKEALEFAKELLPEIKKKFFELQRRD